MSKTCNSCKTENEIISVPYVVHEKAMARNDTLIKRLIAVILVLIVLLVGSNIGWLIYESRMEDTTTTTTEEILADAEDDGVANYIGNDGAIYNGENQSKENNSN